MKTGYQVSIDCELMTKFIEATRKNGHDKNRIVEELMTSYIKQYGQQDASELAQKNLPELLVCSSCGCEYSPRLGACPACENKKIGDVLNAARK